MRIKKSQNVDDTYFMSELVQGGHYIATIDVVIIYLACVIVFCLSIQKAPNQWYSFGIFIGSCILMGISLWLRQYTQSTPWISTTTSVIALTILGVITYFLLDFIYNTEIAISDDVDTTKTTIQKLQDEATAEYNKIKGIFTTIFSPFTKIKTFFSSFSKKS
jgi:hypothetical protein